MVRGGSIGPAHEGISFAVIRVGFGILALTVTGVGVYLLAIGQPVGGFILTA
jgi:hypothetical protein